MAKKSAAGQPRNGQPFESVRKHDDGAVSFMQLPRADKTNLLLLIVLCGWLFQSTRHVFNSKLTFTIYIDVLQGVPIGLAFGSIPFLLKEKLSYSQIGLFSLSNYPYSLKLLWSPLVDALYIDRIGRRKSWIIPTQIIIGFIFLWLGGSIDSLIGNVSWAVLIL